MEWALPHVNSDNPQHLAGILLEQIEAETFVAAIEAHDSLPSTNDRALEISADEAVVTPLLVLTAKQTAGRGRGGNRWWSREGALTFSLLIDAVANDRISQLSLTAGVAACEALREFVPGKDVGLKWPNDIYLGERKICGILVEIPPERSGRVVVGIGLNVNNSLSTAPEELQRTATSLIDCAGQKVDVTAVLVRILQLLQQRLEWLASHDPRLPALWEETSILRGRTIYLENHGRETTGVCQGIDEEGGLLLRTPSGIERIVAGVIRGFE